MTATPDLTEKEWASQVAQLAQTLGYWRHHHYRSDRSSPGWPDEALLRERLILLELKTEKGRLSPAQRDVLRRLHQARVEVYLARPRHLDDLAAVLAIRTISSVDGSIVGATEPQKQHAIAARRRLVDHLEQELA